MTVSMPAQRDRPSRGALGSSLRGDYAVGPRLPSGHSPQMVERVVPKPLFPPASAKRRVRDNVPGLAFRDLAYAARTRTM